MTHAVIVRTPRSALRSRTYPVGIALIFALLATGLLTSPAAAVPHWARQYGVACGMCHLVPPKLNEVGEEFFANGYSLPGLNPIPGGTLPLSALIQVRDENRISDDAHRLHLREVEVIAGGPLGDDGATYFVEWLPFNESLSSGPAARWTCRGGSRFRRRWHSARGPAASQSAAAARAWASRISVPTSPTMR